MSLAFNYRHLYYFWVVAREGSFTRAANRLDMAVQTVSAQVRDLERDLGCLLLRPAGRGITLTEAGVTTLRQADQIFELGDRVPVLAREASTTPVIRLAVGVSDALPKQAVHTLLQPVIGLPHLRLRCDVDEFEDLLADLALHRLDIVLADRVAPESDTLKLHSQSLRSSPFGWYAAPQWYEAAREDFPRSLGTVPVLLPTRHAAVRARLDAWLEHRELRANVVGEFEDNTLLRTFGAAGMGVFPAADFMLEDLARHHNVQRLGDCDGVHENFFAVTPARKVVHPLVKILLTQAGDASDAQVLSKSISRVS